jgi:hypothetical protein
MSSYDALFYHLNCRLKMLLFPKFHLPAINFIISSEKIKKGLI